MHVYNGAELKYRKFFLMKFFKPIAIYLKMDYKSGSFTSSGTMKVV